MESTSGIHGDSLVGMKRGPGWWEQWGVMERKGQLKITSK